jgi:hypothetical protein
LIAAAAAVGVVGGDTQVGLMVEQPIDDIGGLARGRDRDRVVRRLASREVRVEKYRGGALVMSIDRSDGFSGASGREVLSVRARHIGGTE